MEIRESARYHDSGAPPPELGEDGDTYVDDDNGGFYWRDTTGWHPM